MYLVIIIILYNFPSYSYIIYLNYTSVVSCIVILLPLSPLIWMVTLHKYSALYNMQLSFSVMLKWLCKKGAGPDLVKTHYLNCY